MRNAAKRTLTTILLGVTVSFISPVLSKNRVIQSSDMFAAGVPGTPIASAGILTRDRKGVQVSLHMTGLEPGAGYTAWWIVFNKPDDCVEGCGFDDLFSGVGQGFYSTGYIAGADGTANAYASLSEGRIPDGADRLSSFFPLDPASETGLKNSFKAEIHLIAARTHGPLIPGLVAAQIGTFDGACDIQTCQDQQVVVFGAPGEDGEDGDDEEDD